MNLSTVNTGLRTAGRCLGILFYLLFALFPIYWLIKISFTPDKLLYSEGVRMWPSELTLIHFQRVFTESQFPTYFVNSLIVSFGTAFLSTLIAAGAGFAFSRFRFRGKTVMAALL